MTNITLWIQVKYLLRKYLGCDLGGLLPSQTVFGSIGSDLDPFGGVENIGLTIRSPQEDHSKMETATPMPHAFLEHPVQPVPYASTRLNRAQRSRGSPCHSKRTTRPHRPQTIDVGHAFYGQGFPSGYVNSLLLKMAID